MIHAQEIEERQTCVMLFFHDTNSRNSETKLFHYIKFQDFSDFRKLNKKIEISTSTNFRNPPRTALKTIEPLWLPKAGTLVGLLLTHRKNATLQACTKLSVSKKSSLAHMRPVIRIRKPCHQGIYPCGTNLAGIKIEIQNPFNNTKNPRLTELQKCFDCV